MTQCYSGSNLVKQTGKGGHVERLKKLVTLQLFPTVVAHVKFLFSKGKVVDNVLRGVLTLANKFEDALKKKKDLVISKKARENQMALLENMQGMLQGQATNNNNKNNNNELQGLKNNAIGGLLQVNGGPIVTATAGDDPIAVATAAGPPIVRCGRPPCTTNSTTATTANTPPTAQSIARNLATPSPSAVASFRHV